MHLFSIFVWGNFLQLGSLQVLYKCVWGRDLTKMFILLIWLVNTWHKRAGHLTLLPTGFLTNDYSGEGLYDPEAILVPLFYPTLIYPTLILPHLDFTPPLTLPHHLLYPTFYNTPPYFTPPYYSPPYLTRGSA